MTVRFSKVGLPCVLLLARLCAGQNALTNHSKTVNVTAKVFNSANSVQANKIGASAPVAPRTVVRLIPVEAVSSPLPTPTAFVMTQKGKAFHPSLLVVPVGSTISFPNADPFFHNVFSLFNGRRFDLGLYQSGQTRSIAFNREGVSYIFCNIHPEMSAVILSLRTPFYATPRADGVLVIEGVPEGVYRLEVWSEDASADELNKLSRVVQIAKGSSSLGTIVVPETNAGMNTEMAGHLNKFGKPYEAQPTEPKY